MVPPPLWRGAYGVAPGESTLADCPRGLQCEHGYSARVRRTSCREGFCSRRPPFRTVEVSKFLEGSCVGYTTPCLWDDGPGLDPGQSVKKKNNSNIYSDEPYLRRGNLVIRIVSVQDLRYIPQGRRHGARARTWYLLRSRLKVIRWQSRVLARSEVSAMVRVLTQRIKCEGIDPPYHHTNAALVLVCPHI